MPDTCTESSRIILAVAVAAVFVSCAVSVRVIVYMLRMARRIRARLDSERVIIADAQRRLRDGEAREEVPPPAPR
jgi:hypothetical protein